MDVSSRDLIDLGLIIAALGFGTIAFLRQKQYQNTLKPAKQLVVTSNDKPKTAGSYYDRSAGEIS